MARITIDKTQFFAGERSEDFIDDGGYSADSRGVNPTIRKGMIHGVDTLDDSIDSTPDGETIASCKDEELLGHDLMTLDDVGKLYSINGTTKAEIADAGTANGSWSDGTSDLIPFRGDLFATTTREVVRFSGSNYASVDHDWWTNTRSHGALENSYRHPMEVVEGVLYIADKDNLHLWDGTNSQENAMTLPGDCNITAMVKHPNGRYLIVFTAGTANFAGTQNSQIIAYVIDTVSLEFIQEVPLNEQVGAAKVNKGIVYVRYGHENMKFGFFDGSAVQLIRQLPTDGNESLAGYKHTMQLWKEFLLITTDDHVYAYGEINPGQNAFWKAYTREGDCLYCDALDNDHILIQHEDGGDEPMIRRDLSVAGGGMSFQTGKITLPYEAMITKITFEHEEYSGSGTFGFDVYQITTDDERIQIGDVLYNNLGNKVRRTSIYPNVFVDTNMDLEINHSNDILGFSKIVIEYESAE